MSTGDPRATCPVCGESYYVVNGHNCKLNKPIFRLVRETLEYKQWMVEAWNNTSKYKGLFNSPTSIEEAETLYAEMSLIYDNVELIEFYTVRKIIKEKSGE